MKKIFLSLLFIIFFVPINAIAGFCQGNPLPEQTAFCVFESSWLTRIGGSNVRTDKANLHVTIGFGYLYNLNPKKSIGGSIYFSGDDDGTQLGLQFRYRIWLKNKMSIDFAPGILLSGTDNHADPKYPGFVGTISYNIRDLIAISMEFQIRRAQNITQWNSLHEYQNSLGNKTQAELYFGVRGGSYFAIFLPIFFAIAAGAAGG